MLGWSSKLIALAELALLEFPPSTEFPGLTESELKLLCAVTTGQGAYCGPSRNNSHPHNNPDFADFWGLERDIRAGLIRWLCVNRDAAGYVDPRGVIIHAARIGGELDLAFSTVPFPLRLLTCRLGDRIILQFAKVEYLQLSASRSREISADGMVVRGDVRLDNGFSAEGEVRLRDADIGGVLACDAGKFVNRGGYALHADRVKVTGNVFLRDGFSAEGDVRLLGADIGGDLACGAGKFVNRGGYALSADGVKVTGSVFLRNGFSAEGEVRLLGAHIGGSLDCHASKFVNPGGSALSADRVKVTGSVFLRDGFSAEGEVRLLGANIGGDLSCGASKFVNRGGYALSADGVKVTGSVFLRTGFSAEGEVRLSRADIGADLDCSRAQFAAGSLLRAEGANVRGAFFWRSLEPTVQGTLILSHASVGPIVDDPESWPTSGRLALDGFVYARIGGGPADAKRRLDWLNLQRPKPEDRRKIEFRPQPYQQLATVLREAGDNAGARRVLIAMENARRMYGKLTTPGWLWQWLKRVAIGYGYRPWQAIFWGLFIVIVLGFPFFRQGYRGGLITPTDEKAYTYFTHCAQLAPPYYSTFSAGVYSLDSFLPIVNFGQKDHWAPNANRGDRLLARFPWLTCGWLLRFYLWVHIALGWLLTTLFVAGLTPIIRSG